MSFISELKRRNVVRVALAYLVLAWLVLQVGDVLIDSLELPGEYSKFIVILLVLGFVPVIFFSWVYELTPEGIKREKDVRREESITSHTAKKLDVAVIVLLALAIGLFAFDRFSAPGGDRSMATGRPADGADARASIAVLPFVNMSGSEENEYFSDGLTETLLHMLTKIPDLKVAGRTSSFIGPAVFGLVAAEMAFLYERQGIAVEAAEQMGLRLAILSIGVFLLVGLVLLYFVNEKRARARAVAIGEEDVNFSELADRTE